MNKSLLIIGAGQYGQVAKEIAEAMGCFGRIDFLDDNNITAIGRFDDYKKFSVSYRYAIVAMGNSEKRLEWIQKLEEACYMIATLIHPNSCISPSAQIMRGCIIEPMTVIQSGTTVSDGCIISSGAVINHNSFCCEGCHVDCNATIVSNTLVPAESYIAYGAVFRNNNGDTHLNSKMCEKRVNKFVKIKPHGPLPVNGREYCFEDGM